LKDLSSVVKGQFAENQLKSAIYVSESAATAAKEIEFFFSSKSTLQSPAYFNNCSCLVIKPHLIT
jgi:nucleoside-diphosphate kinase